MHSLRIVYRDAHSSFDELLRKDNTFTVHDRNIQFLAIELYKVKNVIAPEFMSDIFPLKDDIVYCLQQDFVTRRVNTVYNYIETLSYLGPKIWPLIPNEIKSLPSLELLKKIKVWKPTKYPCRLCKTCEQHRVY